MYFSVFRCMQGYFSKYIHHIDRDNNMDLIRYVLAFSVLIGHFNYLCGADIPWIISTHNRVGVFFAMSGFVLVGGILKGQPYSTFVKKRIWRICPSYFFVIILSALLLAFISPIGLYNYFTDSGLYKYLIANLSFLNFLHPDLPGLFEDGVNNAVNGSLWTMKVEWQLTLTAPILIWLIKKYRLSLIKITVFIIVSSLAYKLLFNYLYLENGKKIYEILGRQFMGQTFFFYMGILIYCYYEQFKQRLPLLIIVSGIIYCIFCIVESDIYNPLFQPLVITIFFMGLSLLPKNLARYIDGGNNISYEIFLCHYPIIQLVNHYGLMERHGTILTFIFVVIATLAFATITYITAGRLYKYKNRKKVYLSVPS